MGIGFKPLGARLVIERMEHEQKTPGGIIIPDTAKEKPTQGKVVAVGPGRRLDDGKLIALDAKVGDVVLFSKWGGSEINIRNKEYIIVKEEDILGIIE